MAKKIAEKVEPATKQIAYVARDFWAAENYYFELRRFALLKKIVVICTTKPRPRIETPAQTITFFGFNNWQDHLNETHHDFMRGMVGLRFDTIYVAMVQPPEIMALLRAQLAEGGQIVTGVPTLE